MRIALLILTALIAIAALMSAWADARFQRETDALVRQLLARVPKGHADIVSANELASLPEPVQRWLQASGVVGLARARCVRLQQRGELRTSPEQAFMPARADQYFTIDAPGFVWRVRVRMGHVLPIIGRDSFVDGKGRMQIRAGGMIPVVDAKGPAIDQGTLLRFLGEMVWFPSAALSPYMRWEGVDASSARATMTYGAVSASAVFQFDSGGRMTEMHAMRFMDASGGARLTPWKVTANAWRQFHGVQVPTDGAVSWELSGGEFTYYRWQITSVDYDIPALYEQ